MRTTNCCSLEKSAWASTQAFAENSSRLKPLATPNCPFANLPSAKTGHWGEGVTAEDMKNYVWLKPEIVAEIKFTEWTTGSVQRHPEFIDLRDDKSPKEVIREP
jgi:bifunctional non-homologous end joining protein LigD